LYQVIRRVSYLSYAGDGALCSSVRTLLDAFFRGEMKDCEVRRAWHNSRGPATGAEHEIKIVAGVKASRTGVRRLSGPPR
jgi:hypothetical protein